MKRIVRVGRIDEIPSGIASARVLRGGSWFNDGRYCRSAYRNRYEPDGRDQFFGFRVVRVRKEGV